MTPPPPPPSSPSALPGGPIDWPTAPPSEPPLRATSPLGAGAGGWPAPRPPVGPTSPPPAPRRTGLIVAIVALTIAILAVTFADGVLVSRDPSGSATPATSSTTSTTAKRSTTTTTEDTGGGPNTTSRTPPTTDPGSGSTGTINKDELEAEITKIESFIEKDRGHPFKDHVAVEVLAQPDFQKRVLDSFESEADAMKRQGDLLKALGLIPADLDVLEAQRKLLGSGVLGFYDPTTKQLVVGGDHIGPFLREVLAHELTHALDDQYFNLDRPDIDKATDGSDWSFLALVEGSAKRVENDYVAAMSNADRDTLEQEQFQLGMDQVGALLSTPMVLARIQLTPYDYGEPFVRAIVDRDGIAGLDAAFGRWPTTSEQVLHADKYFTREPSVAVTTPPTDGDAQDNGVLGELMTGIVLHGGDDQLGGLGNMSEADLQDLLDKIMNGEITQEELDQILGGGTLGAPGLGSSGLGAIDTVAGWGGDRYVTWSSPAQGVCVRIDWKMDTPTALKAMRVALDTWSAADGGKPVIEQPADDLVQATRCSGPVSSSPPSTPPSSRQPRTPPTTTLS